MLFAYITRNTVSDNLEIRAIHDFRPYELSDFVLVAISHEHSDAMFPEPIP